MPTRLFHETFSTNGAYNGVNGWIDAASGWTSDGTKAHSTSANKQLGRPFSEAPATVNGVVQPNFLTVSTPSYAYADNGPQIIVRRQSAGAGVTAYITSGNLYVDVCNNAGSALSDFRGGPKAVSLSDGANIKLQCLDYDLDALTARFIFQVIDLAAPTVDCGTIVADILKANLPGGGAAGSWGISQYGGTACFVNDAEQWDSSNFTAPLPFTGSVTSFPGLTGGKVRILVGAIGGSGTYTSQGHRHDLPLDAGTDFVNENPASGNAKAFELQYTPVDGNPRGYSVTISDGVASPIKVGDAGAFTSEAAARLTYASAPIPTVPVASLSASAIPNPLQIDILADSIHTATYGVPAAMQAFLRTAAGHNGPTVTTYAHAGTGFADWQTTTPVSGAGQSPVDGAKNNLNALLAGTGSIVYFAIGTNDVYAGTALATITAGYDATIAAVVGAGKKILLAPMIYRDGPTTSQTLRDTARQFHAYLAAKALADPAHVYYIPAQENDYISYFASGVPAYYEADGQVLHPSSSNSAGGAALGKFAAKYFLQAFYAPSTASTSLRLSSGLSLSGGLRL